MAHNRHRKDLPFDVVGDVGMKGKPGGPPKKPGGPQRPMQPPKPAAPRPAAPAPRPAAPKPAAPKPAAPASQPSRAPAPSAPKPAAPSRPGATPVKPPASPQRPAGGASIRTPVNFPTAPPRPAGASIRTPPSRPVQPPPARPTGGPVRGAVGRPPMPPQRPMAGMAAMGGAALGGAMAMGALPNIAGGAIAEEISMEVNSLQSRISMLQSEASMSNLQSEVADLDQRLNRLAQSLDAVRKQGYVYGGDLDTALYQIISQWQSVKPQVDQAIYQNSQSLGQSLASLHGPLAQLAGQTGNAARARPLLNSASMAVDNVYRTVSNTTDSIRNMYSNLQSDMYPLESRINRAATLMSLVGAAKFAMAEGEAAIAAVPGKLDKDGKDDPEGFLLVTNKRLIFEQRQEIATKKVLFIATEKELVQQVLVDTPLANVSGVKASKKGLLGNEDHLDVDYSRQSVHFHINGQDSKEWQSIIERAKSGGFESERATAQAGMSVADLTGPVTQADYVRLQAQVNDLQIRAMLSFAKDALEDMETKVGALPRQLSETRARGYVFEKALETKVESLAGQWDRVKQSVNDDVRQQSATLGRTMQTLQGQMSQLMGFASNPEAGRSLYMQVMSAVASAEAQAAAAEQSIFGQYDDFQLEVEGLSAHFDWANWMLEALSTASFRLMPTEGGVAAAQANWLRSNTEPMGGIVFLTDQRFIFEEREGEFSVVLDVPVSAIESVSGASEQGENKDEEHLALKLGSGAPMSSAVFQLVGPLASEWKAMIGRAKAGDYTSDRAVAIDQADVDRLKSAPTHCPNCGSAFNKPILRGQTEITCDYCGAVTRI